MDLSTTGHSAFLTIDAGGTYLKSAILDSSGEVFPESVLSVESFSDGSKEEILRTFRGIISKGQKFVGEKKMKLKGVGIAFPGPFNIEKATPLMKHKFQAIYGLDLRKCFYQIPDLTHDIPIKFIHDANAVLIGEIWKGNAQGFDNVAVVTLGTGLGFAISENGTVMCNEIGGPFLSIYKLPYKDGILEDYTAKRGLVRIYRELSGKTNADEINVSDIGQWADNGDAASIQTFRKVGEILAESLHDILMEKKIECILFGGQISRSFHHIEGSLREGLKEVECLHKISTINSIDSAALLGAFLTIGS
jgi:glucokinase